jgi:hypothetical protein
MSEIPFVQALGDALERAITEDLAHRAPARRRLRLPRRRGRLLIALAALALGGGALAATLQSSTRLAAGTVNCSYGASDTSAGVQAVALRGLSPVAACREEYRRGGPAALDRPGVKLVACQQAGFYVDVMVADGRPSQCRRLGLLPLPASYAAAVSRVNALEQALGALQRGHDCIPPTVLVREVRDVLARLGFNGWRAELNHPPLFATGGPCGQFPGTDTQPSDPYLALNPDLKTVMIGSGPALSTDRLRDVVEPMLITDSGRRCLSLGAARALTRRLLAPAHFSARFAITAELVGEQFNPARQMRYDHGCAVIVDFMPAPSGRTMDVWVSARSAPPLPHGQAAPASSGYVP